MCKPKLLAFERYILMGFKFTKVSQNDHYRPRLMGQEYLRRIYLMYGLFPTECFFSLSVYWC